MNSNFQIICLTETWCQNIEMETNSNFQLQNYSVIHQVRSSEKHSGGMCIFIHNSLTYKLNARCAKGVNNIDCESLSVEIINKTTKNIIVHVIYRQPAGSNKIFQDHIKSIFENNKNTKAWFRLVKISR